MAYKFNVGDKVRVTQAVLDGEVYTGIDEAKLVSLGTMAVRDVTDDGAQYSMQENVYIFDEDWLESATEDTTDNPWKLGVNVTVGGYTVTGFGYIADIPVYICNTAVVALGNCLTAVCVGAKHLNNQAGRS